MFIILLRTAKYLSIDTDHRPCLGGLKSPPQKKKCYNSVLKLTIFFMNFAYEKQISQQTKKNKVDMRFSLTPVL